MNTIIEKKARELEEAIVNSEEYQEYAVSLEQLKEDPELYHQVNEFRKANFVLQNGSNSLEQRHKLEELVAGFDLVREDIRVADYLQRELDLCRLLQKVNGILYQSIDLGMEFF